MNTAYKCEAYKIAKKLLKSGKPFQLVNQCGEHKDFIPGDMFYRADTLQLQFKFAYAMGDVLSVKA